MSEEKPPEFDLTQELQQLGERLKTLLRVARDHPQTQDFERQVKQAMRDLGDHVDRAMASAKQDERVKSAEEHIKQAAQSIKDGGAKEDIERGLAKGVRALNEQIQRVIEDAQKPSQK
ncbi:MAG: hypothetical protein HY868_18245 [Chloroflexi bacterium]|nr:hypothetical protein [Chloroflexota bacterium]